MPNLGSSLKGKEWASWEIDPSTRDNTHIWTKYAPVDSTLSVSGTAQNLYAISPGFPTVNLATNPSFETGAPPTGYTLTGSAIAQSNTVARSGTFSLRITPNNAAAGEGAFWSSIESFGSGGDKNEYLVVSAYFQDNANSGNGARIVLADSSGTTLTNGNTIVLTNAWQRSTAAVRLSTIGGNTYRVYFVTSAQHGTVFYVDDFQTEILENIVATTYCDGAQGLNYEWDGTAHASTSRRKRTLVAVRGFTMHFTRDTYIAFDTTASSTTGVFVRAGSDWSCDIPIHVTSNISFINVNSGELPRVYGSVWGVPKGA